MTILETIPIIEAPGNYDILTIVSLIITILSIIIGIFMCLDDYEILGTIFTITAGIGAVVFIIGIILMVTEPKVDTGRKQYIIRINENTSINEIYENYKIIDHIKYTDIYTVEELEND